MKTEEHVVEVRLPNNVVVKKRNRYTWDENKFATWEAAMEVPNGGGFESVEFIEKVT